MPGLVPGIHGSWQDVCRRSVDGRVKPGQDEGSDHRDGGTARRRKIMARLTIRTRLILMTSVGLLVLIATNAYLTRTLSENSAGMVEAAGLLAGIEQADKAQIAF